MVFSNNGLLLPQFHHVLAIFPKKNGLSDFLREIPSNMRKHDQKLGKTYNKTGAIFPAVFWHFKGSKVPKNPATLQTSKPLS
jgi:hypothetical protein